MGRIGKAAGLYARTVLRIVEIDECPLLDGRIRLVLLVGYRGVPFECVRFGCRMGRAPCAQRL